MAMLASFKLKVMTIIFMSFTLSACAFEKAITFLTDLVTVIKALIIIFSWFPPAADLQYFDAQLATQNLNAQNITITSTSGDVEITIKDENDGTILGQNTFGYTVNAQDQVLFTDPTTVTNWVRSFSTYDGFVEVSVKTTLDATPPPEGQTGNVSSTLVYNGAPLASATASFTNSNGSGCGAGFCEIQ